MTQTTPLHHMASELDSSELDHIRLEQDDFVAFLCAREKEVAGHAGTRFGSPLVEWLSTLTRYQCTIEDTFYGWMSLDYQWRWRTLPTWCIRFQRKIDGYAFRPLRGDEALDILASIQ
jgi:hypothetical protein